MPEKHRTAFPADAECRTQRSLAREGVVSAEMARVAEREHLRAGGDPRRGRRRPDDRSPPTSTTAGLDPIAIGLAARVKINANIGSSPITSDIDEEVEKLRWPSAGAPTR